jgi:hypothetical protein
MPPTSFWSWPGWGSIEALGTLGAALVALTVYLSEVARRRRADRKSVRVWAAHEGGTTVVYITNDSPVPIVETRITVLYQNAAWISAILPVVRWSAIGWISTGPHIIHPSTTVALAARRAPGSRSQWPGQGSTPALVRLTYEASATLRTTQFTRFKRAPRKQLLTGVVFLEEHEPKSLGARL